MSQDDDDRVLVPEEELRMHRVMQRLRAHIDRQGIGPWSAAPSSGVAEPDEEFRDYAAISGEIIC